MKHNEEQKRYENLSHHRLRRLHRLQLRVLYAEKAPGHPAGQPGQADLRRQPGKPERGRGRPPPRLCPGRHLRQGAGGGAVPPVRLRLRHQLCGREPRGPLHRQPRNLCPDQRHGHRQPAAARQGSLVRPRRPHLEAGQEVPAGVHRRGVRRAGGRGLLHRDHPPVPPQPLLVQQGQRRSVRHGLPRHLRHAGEHHPLLQQLRALSVPRKADPPHDPQRQKPQAAARVRRRHADSGLAVRGGPLQGHRHGGRRRQGGRGVQRGRPQRAAQHLHRQDHHLPAP